jgi:acyl-CoA reductase-like NAD-dependent aldehyde dehydrogenase
MGLRPVPLAGERFTTDESTVVASPYDGHEIGRTPLCTAADVDRAVASATAALHAGLPRWKRADILDRAAVCLAAREEEFAQIISAEAAKPIRTARVEAQRAVGTFQFAAAEARTFDGEMVPLDAIPSGEGKVGFAMRVPIGVIGAIAPFNFPLNLVVHKVAPAIAAGCPVVLKPAAQTPFSAIVLAEMLIDECGLPAEWLHVVTGVPGRADRLGRVVAVSVIAVPLMLVYLVGSV